MTSEIRFNEDRGTVTYPCLVLTGIDFREEIDYFKNLDYGRTGEKTLPLYVMLNGTMEKLSDVVLTHLFLISINQISNGSYGLYLYADEDTYTEIDYKSDDMLLKCMKVW